MNTLSKDEKIMFRCLQLAKNGLGTTAPNPMVGCVIVCDNKIIGEGYTSPYGGAHAEVNAIASVKDKTLLSQSTLYVTLEPCAHFGKTPPCADLIIKYAIPKVVIGLRDPHKKVAGKGIEKLENSGCTAVVGVLKAACKEHHKRFLTNQIKKRPYIILKWAQTLDGFIAPQENKRNQSPTPFWITNSTSRQLVHKWRSEEQGILVGTTTVLADNPKLDVRHWTGTSPIRIVLDRDLKIPKLHHVLDGLQKTIVFTTQTNVIDSKNITYHVVDFNNNIAEQICGKLYDLKLQSIIVEGGTTTLQAFIDAKLWDEARIFTGPVTFEKGIKAPTIKGKLVLEQKLSNDRLQILKND